MKSRILMCFCFIAELLETLVYGTLAFIKKSRVHFPDNSGKNLYILSNGPSLAKHLEQNMEFFAHKKIMCVNQMVNTEYYEKLKPQYYIIADSRYWHPAKSRSDFPDIEKDQKKWNSITPALVEKTDWPMYLFLPELAKENKKLCRRLSENKYIRIIFMNCRAGFRGFNCAKLWLWEHNWCMPVLMNVLNAAVYAGILMKFSKIYLLGADHTFFHNIFIDSHNRLKCEIQHVYSEDNANKFMTDYLGNGYTMGQYLEENMVLWKNYYDLEALARKNHIYIYNATENSLIDAFRRVRLFS